MSKQSQIRPEDRALEALKRFVTKEQYDEYKVSGTIRYFGKKNDYILRKGDAIEVIDKDSLSPIGTLCAIPDPSLFGEFPPTGVIIHQLLWLKIYPAWSDHDKSLIL